MTATADWGIVLSGTRFSSASERDRGDLLRRAVRLGPSVADGVVGCSLTVGSEHGWTTPHAWQPVAVALDGAQYEAGTGPCIEAASTGEVQALDDIDTDGRFAGFAAAAADHGVLSSFSVPLLQTPQRSALNLYATRRGDIDTVRGRAVAGLLARVVAVLLGAPERPDRDAGSGAELAVGRGATVRRAVSVHAAEIRTDHDEAFFRLAMRTRREGRPMGELADDVLGDGDSSRAVSS